MSGDPDARVTVAARPRRSGQPVEATRRAGRLPRRAFLLALAATVAVAGIALARRAAHRPRPAPAAPASASTASAALDSLAIARAAEQRGDLARAALAYRDAYTAHGDPELLEHLGDLYERLGDRAQAAAYLQRYLDATPHPSEHQAIADRIARLSPQVRTAPPPASCACCADAADPDTTQYLCAHATSPLCMCWSREADGPMCPQPFQPCTEPPCDQLLAAGSSIVWSNCPDRDYREPNLRGRPGAPCTGYLAGGLLGGVQHASPGELSCDFCVGPGQTVAEAYAIHGTAGAPCTGYDSSTGELERGHVCCGR